MKFKSGRAIAALAIALATPLHAFPRGDEPITVPRTIQQGIDFVFVDPDMGNVARLRQRPENWLERVRAADPLAALVGQGDPNPVFLQLVEALEEYQASWGSLPQERIPAGPALKPGSSGARVELLRRRLGLAPASDYDGALAAAVTNYQTVHGLGRADGIAGAATLASLNLGAGHYARRLAVNVERAYRLPPVSKFDRYVVVDSGAAEAQLFDGDRMVDSMRVIVGSPRTMTPMMAVIMRSAKANPYWNVPPELIQSLTAKRVREQGLSYLRDFHYEVLSDWSATPRLLDPQAVDWTQVAAGKSDILVRQMPGPWNSMGKMKFDMANDYGIYLHDTPQKEAFSLADRWVSNGCVRLEDYRRFASWVFGTVPQATSEREEKFDLPQPVPVYMTYLTVSAGNNGVTFRADPYGLDALAMPQMFGPAGAADPLAAAGSARPVAGRLEAI